MLTYTTDDGAGRVSVRFDRFDSFDRRSQYAWRLEAAATADGPWETFAEGSDLRLGSGADADDVEALRSLLGFFDAWREAIDYETRTGHASENADLFPESARMFAYAYGDELSLALATREDA